MKNFVLQKNLNFYNLNVSALDIENILKINASIKSRFVFLADVVPMLSHIDLSKSEIDQACIKIRRNSDYNLIKKAKIQCLLYSGDIKG